MDALVVPTTNTTLVIPFAELMHAEAEGSYTRLHLDGDRHQLVSKRIGSLEQSLPTALFFRCHESHVVSLSKVRRIDTVDGLTVELVNGKRVPVARRRYAEFLQVLRGK
ncbi:MAG: LytTR family DNA-binding domain-containing protein [Flavobacteriales bacterium]